jgi:hypothetical protein
MVLVIYPEFPVRLGGRREKGKPVLCQDACGKEQAAGPGHRHSSARGAEASWRLDRRPTALSLVLLPTLIIRSSQLAPL